ncbi:MAG: AAA family ATPase, partial [Lachnospiraceae bacterium]|nr:AAA family ATPase [Lachnospiraceae bacterium]
MGIYLNPDNDGFWTSVRSKIYVDKTDLIACTNELLNTEQKFICVSRPRRFGKSMALKMLAAYYSCGCDSVDLFKGLKIEREKSFR